MINCAIAAGFKPLVVTKHFQGQSLYEHFDDYDVIRFRSTLRWLWELYSHRRYPIFLMSMIRVNLLVPHFSKRTVIYTKWPYYSKNRIKKAFQVNTRKKASRLICFAEWEKNELSGYIDSSRLDWLPSCIDVDYFSEPIPKNLARKHFGLSDDDFVAIFVANLREMKDPLGVLEAFVEVAADNPHARLIIAGHNLCLGETKKRMRELLDTEVLQGKVLKTGFLEREELRLAYAAADCQINNSIAIKGVIYETQCLAIYEGAIQNLPACLPRLRIFTEIFKDALFHDDSHELAENIKRLATDPALRRRMGEGHKKVAEKYDYRSFDLKLTNILRAYHSELHAI